MGRVSLRSIFVALAFLACLATILKLRFDLAEARRQLSELRQKGGHLEVSDLNKIHAVKVPSDHWRQWIFRVYIPDHIDAELYCYPWDFTKGFPDTDKHPRILGPGEHLLTYSIREDKFSNAEINWSIRSPNETRSGEFIQGRDPGWTQRQDKCANSPVLNDLVSPADDLRWQKYYTVQLDEAEPFALLRFGPKEKVGEDIERPGVTVWLNPRKKTP